MLRHLDESIHIIREDAPTASGYLARMPRRWSFGVQGEAAGEDFVAGGIGPAVALELLAAALFSIVDDSAYTICMYVTRSLEDVVDELRVRHPSYFRRTHLNPLIRAGVVAMTHPGRPNHPDQAYVLTDAGAALKARRAGGG